MTSDTMKPGKLVLALDAHGGDFGPEATIPAALDILTLQPNLEIVICGIPESIEPVLKKHESEPGFKQCSERLSIIGARHALASDARPVAALRRGPWIRVSGCSR